jgi:DNA-binding NtrC family response regulator
MDFYLPSFANWSATRSSLKHNWFDHLPRFIRTMREDDEIPEWVRRWSADYPKLSAWLSETLEALSPQQILDLPIFESWPEELRNHHKAWIHERFSNPASDLVKLVANCQTRLEAIDREIKPLLQTGVCNLNGIERSRLANTLEEVAERLRKFPDCIEWPDSREPDPILRVLIIDDLLGRGSVRFAGKRVISGNAIKELRELRQSFCRNFNLLNGDRLSDDDVPGKPIARAHFCSGQRWDPDLGFVNDLQVVRDAVLGVSGNSDSQWSLVLVDVFFNTGKPDQHGLGDRESPFGLDKVIPWLRSSAPKLPAVALTSDDNEKLIRHVQSLGLQYLHKSSASGIDLIHHVSQTGMVTPLQMRRAMHIPEDFVAYDPQMIDVLHQAWIGAHDKDGKTILITGESGAGKGKLAEFIHKASLRATQPLVFVNCAEFSRELGRSELFGYFGKAFTGSAGIDTPGVFQQADGGTLVLDEFGDLDEELQAELLRAMEPTRAKDRVIRPVGNPHSKSNLKTQVDVRIICCTNRDLKLLRKDLFDRVSDIIEIPPLRERQADIVPLARFFLDSPNHLSAPGLDLDETACAFLATLDIPGNARMLKQLLTTATTGKGTRNIISGADLAKSWPIVLKKFSSLRVVAPAVISDESKRELSSDEFPEEMKTLSDAIRMVLSAAEQKSGWDHLSQRQLDDLDRILRGQVWKVVAILAEWIFNRAEDVPSIAEYLTGERKRGRLPEDDLKRLLKLDPRIFDRITETLTNTNNSRVRRIIDACRTDWRKRGAAPRSNEEKENPNR